DGMVGDPLPSDASAALTPTLDRKRVASQSKGGVFVDTAPRRAQRSQDLPLFEPPQPRLRSGASAEGGGIAVTLEGIDEPASLRWESDGVVEGEGMEVCWFPESESDQLRVAVRTQGGVAIVTLRARYT
ncbi:MAG: hypothetical protein JRH20_11275, partial [Deltaproteobacteria bacterium]|nr:hypothetical protein [Deltaproteobacteria bacterium]